LGCHPVTVHIYTQTIHRTTQIITNVEECGPCPVFASFTLAFALQARKKHGKISVRVRKTSVRLRKTSEYSIHNSEYSIHNSEYSIHNSEYSIHTVQRGTKPDGSVTSRECYGGKSYDGHVTFVH
jgi:hypothetical protein